MSCFNIRFLIRDENCRHNTHDTTRVTKWREKVSGKAEPGSPMMRGCRNRNRTHNQRAVVAPWW